MPKLMLLVAVLCCSAAAAEQRIYWVLGSFSQEQNAIREQQRLETNLHGTGATNAKEAVTVEVRRSSTGLYRLIVPAAGLQRIKAKELVSGAWLAKLPISPGELEQASRAEIIEPNVSPAPPKQQENSANNLAEKYPRIQQGQSLSSYCETLGAGAPGFCEHGRVMLIEESARRLDIRMEALVEYCNQVTLAQELIQICSDLRR